MAKTDWIGKWLLGEKKELVGVNRRLASGERHLIQSTKNKHQTGDLPGVKVPKEAKELSPQEQAKQSGRDIEGITAVGQKLVSRQVWIIWGASVKWTIFRLKVAQHALPPQPTFWNFQGRLLTARHFIFVDGQRPVVRSRPLRCKHISSHVKLVVLKVSRYLVQSLNT